MVPCLDIGDTAYFLKRLDSESIRIYKCKIKNLFLNLEDEFDCDSNVYEISIYLPDQRFYHWAEEWASKEKINLVENIFTLEDSDLYTTLQYAVDAAFKTLKEEDYDDD